MALLMRWLHIAGVIVGIGGAVFVRVALLPALSKVDQATAQTVSGEAIRRYRPILHTAILAIIVSGIYNFINLRPAPGAEIASVYVRLFSTKIVLALTIFTVAILLTSSKPREVVRRNRATFLAVNLILAAIIIFLSAYLRSLRI